MKKGTSDQVERISLPSIVPALWACLLIVRAVGAFIGLDRLPLVPSLPAEVLINDPALALSEGRGLIGVSFEHSINGLDRMYAHFPPVFIFMQSLVYRALGFSAFTLRGLGALAGVAGFAVFLLVLREFYLSRVLDRAGLVLGSLLLMLEPTTLIQFRQGRMESTNILFGAVAFYLTVLAGRSDKLEMPLWIASSVCVGFGLATHPSAMLFVLPIAAWSLLRVRRFGGSHGWVTWLALNALPLGVFVVIMLGAYGSKTIDALAQMQYLSHYNPGPSLALGMLASVIARGAAGELQTSGGFAVALLALAPLLAGFRCLAVRKSRSATPSPEWVRVVAGSAVVLFVQCLLVAWVLPWSGPNRVVMTTPFAIVCCAVSLSYLPGSVFRFAASATALAMIAEAGIQAGYFTQLRGGGAGRGPARFDRIVDAIPKGARVAASPEFWFAFHHRGRPVTLVYRGLDEPRYWNESPGSFSAYDVVILDPTSEDYKVQLAKAKRDKPIERVLHTWRRDFTMLERVQLEKAGLH